MNALFEKLANQFNPFILLLTRVAVGYMFLLHGTAKFFELPVSMTKGNGSVPLFSMFGCGRCAGNCGRYLVDFWFVYSFDFVCFGRTNGGGVFYVSRNVGRYF